MATFAHTCTGCGKQLAIPERYAGRDLKCPACGAPFRVEPPEPTVPVPPPPPMSVEEPFPVAPPPVAAVLPASDEVPAVTTEVAALPEVSDGGAVYWRLRRIGVLSAALVAAVTNALLGLGVALAIASAAGFLARLAPIVHPSFGGGISAGLSPGSGVRRWYASSKARLPCDASRKTTVEVRNTGGIAAPSESCGLYPFSRTCVCGL